VAGLRKRKSGFPTHIVVAVFVALLILFFWLQFLVAQEIETLGRQILETNRELERLRRENAALEHAICTEMAQERMAQRAEAMGYALHRPVYLPLAEPLAPAEEEQTRLLLPLPADGRTAAPPPTFPDTQAHSPDIALGRRP